MAHGKVEKTNAARLLDRAKITYELVPYRVDEEHLAATHVAEELGEDVGSVFKTLVLRGDRTGHFVCVVPADHEVDLKAAARVSGNKKADLIPMKELLPVTGYIRGGCSPIGMKKQFPTYIHSSAASLPAIYISAGVRGLQLKIAPAELIAFVGGDRGGNQPPGIGLWLFPRFRVFGVDRGRPFGDRIPIVFFHGILYLPVRGVHIFLEFACQSPSVAQREIEFLPEPDFQVCGDVAHDHRQPVTHCFEQCDREPFV